MASTAQATHRQAIGLCVRCGTAPPRSERVTCEPCGSYYIKLQIERRRRRGGWECRGCHRQFDDGFGRGQPYCVECRSLEQSKTRKNTGYRSRYIERKSAGLCVKCGSPNDVVSSNGKRRIYCGQCYGQKEKERYRVRSVALKREAMLAYSPSGGCVCCGEWRLGLLTLDHIDNNGAAHRREMKETRATVQGAAWYTRLRLQGWPHGYQTMCMSCNWGKHRNGGQCPHRTEQPVPTVGGCFVASL
jgi:hypothetical protein